MLVHTDYKFILITDVKYTCSTNLFHLHARAHTWLCMYILHLWCTTYRIAGNFRGRKLSHESMKYKISRRKLSWIHHRPDIMRNKPKWATPIFVEKTFTNGIRSTKFVKVFSLEGFPLYGTYSLAVNKRNPTCSLLPFLYMRLCHCRWPCPATKQEVAPVCLAQYEQPGLGQRHHRLPSDWLRPSDASGCMLSVDAWSLEVWSQGDSVEDERELHHSHRTIATVYQ